MSSPASPRSGEVGEVARQSRRGCPHSRKAAFQQVCQSGNVDSFRTPPPAAPPLSALRTAEEDIATYPPSTAHNHIFASITDLSTHNPKPSTLNPQPSTHLRHKKPLHCRSSARQHRGKPHQLLSRNGRLSLPCPKQFIPCMRFGFRKTCKPLSRPSDAFPPDGQFIPSLPPNIQTLS